VSAGQGPGPGSPDDKADPASDASHGWIPFDPATGDWIPGEVPAPPVPPEARRRGLGPMLWTVLLGIDIGILAIFVLLTAIAWIWPSSLPGGSDAGYEVTPGLLWGQVLFNFITLGIIPFAWVMGTRVRPWEGTLRYLQLHSPGKGILQGILWGVASLGALILLGLLLHFLHYDSPNDEADKILGAVTPVRALALALSAGVCEEIFFRGLMQKRLGVWGQAILFGLFHLSYGTPLQVLVPAALGLLYGFLVKRGAPLWVPITAHFLFDFVQLSSPFWLPKGI
jgi:membrane protease YdiL (CAAX protease family)